MTSNCSRAIRFDNDRITINAEATFQNLLDAIDTAPARELSRFWKAENGANVLFPHRPDSPPETGRFRLNHGVPPPHYELPSIRPREVWGIAADLRGLGFEAQSMHLLTDTINTYIDRYRDIDVLTLAEPIGITIAAYPFWGERVLGFITDPPEPGSCRIVETFTIPAGHYLCCGTSRLGNHVLDHVRRINTIPDRDQITAIPGIGAEEIRARCRNCDSRWTASGGSQQFRPEAGPSKRTWDFAKAVRSNTSDIACPHRSCDGQLTFTN
ncbi:hypothetical protein AB0A73_10295 [Glycomyces sp. NPDC047369]